MANCNCIRIFDRWLQKNLKKFKGHHPVYKKTDRRGTALYKFVGVTDHLTLHVCKDGGCIVSVDIQGKNIDHIDFDVHPSRNESGKYYEPLIIPKYRRYYKTIEDFYINECCKCLLKWANRDLIDSHRLLMVIWGGGSSYSRILEMKELKRRNRRRKHLLKDDKDELYEIVNVLTGDLNEEISVLHHAAYFNNISELKILLDAGIDPDVRTRDGSSPLHFALSNDSLKAAQLLLKAGAQLNSKSYGAQRALYVASAKGYIESVKYLLSKGVPVNGKTKSTKKWPPLSVAVSNPGKEYITITDLLLKNKADPRAKDSHGRTPLEIIEKWEVHPDNTLSDLKTYKKRKLLLMKALSGKSRKVRYEKK